MNSQADKENSTRVVEGILAEKERVAVDKGKAFMIDDSPPQLVKNNLVHEAGPSNSTLISVETIIDPRGFLGINNVPLNDPIALIAARPLLGFIDENNNRLNDSELQLIANSPVHGVVNNVVRTLEDDLQSPDQDIMVSDSSDTIVANSPQLSNNVAGNIDNVDSVVNHAPSLLKENTTANTPVSNIRSQVVATDMQIINTL